MSLVMDELLPFVCLNFNDFFRPQPCLSKQWMEFHETDTEYILSQCDDVYKISRGSHQLYVYMFYGGPAIVAKGPPS